MAALFVAAGIAIALASIASGSHAKAAISCPAHQNTAEETEFIGLLQAWRNANIAGSYQLTVSAPLNAAAAHYADYLANTPGAAGHYAEPGYPPPYAWAARAVDCGYPASIAAGGEGLAVVESSGVISVGAQLALNIMTAEKGGGVWVPSNVGLPVKCVGAAKSVSANGRKVAWVTLLFATSGNCPQAVSGGGGNPSPSLSPTKTPTPTPTPTPHRAFAPALSRDGP